MIIISSYPVLPFGIIRLPYREFILICKQPMSLLEFLVHSTLFPHPPTFFILDLQMFSQTGKILFHSSSR